MKKALFVLCLIFIFSGCTSMDVKSAKNIENTEICVINNELINPDFTAAYLRQIKSNGYRAKVINASEANNCEFTSTYTATYGNHWGLYLATAQLKILHKGKVIGEANYKVPYVSPAKHGRVEGKINDMVDQLLPVR